MVRCKRALSLVLALVMMLGMIPFNMNANADSEDGPYTIIWKIDGAEADNATVAKDDFYAYGGDLPTKAGDEAKTWVFTGWKDGNGDKYYSSFPKATGDVTYEAVFESSPRKYTVTFVDYGGATLTQKDYNNNTPAADVERPSVTPTKPDDAKNTYTFTGWNLVDAGGDVRTVTSNAVYEPTFSASPRQYKVTWNTGSGSETSYYEYGETPSFSGETPTKAEDAENTYTFAGWSPAPSAVTGDATYTAVFSNELKTPDDEHLYTIKWVGDDGKAIGQNLLVAGTTPTPPAAPVKASDMYYDYAFDAWTPAVVDVTTDAVYTAKYTKTPRTYTLNFTNTSGETVLETVTDVSPDAIPEYTGETPTKPETKEASYAFAGWLTTIDTTTGIITRAAQFAAIAKEYPVVFTNEDGKVLQVKPEKYGAVPTEPAAPAKESTVRYHYSFTGWSPAVDTVKGGVVYTANFTEALRDYEMLFVNYDDELVKNAGVHPYGTELADIKPDENPTRPPFLGTAYEFKAWEEDVDPVNSVITYKAAYDETERYVTILWMNYNDALLEKDYMRWSSSELPTYDGAEPTKESTVDKVFTFDGWKPVVTPASNDETYVAQFKDSPRTYEIRWKDEIGELRVDTFKYGDTPSYAGAEPTKASTAQKNYTFNGWAPSITAVTGPATYTAQFDESPREYTITILFDAKDASDAEVKTGKLTTLSVPYDKTPAYTLPTEFEDAQYKYTLNTVSPMDKDFEPVTKDATYTAHYFAELRKYTISWVNGDGTEIQGDPVATYGSDPNGVYSSGTPTKKSVKEPVSGKVLVKYTFNGTWQKQSDGSIVDTFSPVSGGETYTAQFTTYYNIDWVDGDGNPLKSELVEENVLPVYSGETPTKTHPNAPDWRYAWDTTDPWTPDVVPAIAPAVYQAQFTEERNQYNITWDYPDPNHPEADNELTNDHTIPANTPLYKPDEVPEFPTWVDQHGNPYVPGDIPNEDKIYKPVFDITWDNPNDPDYVDQVVYHDPVNKPDDDKLEDGLETKPWINGDNVPYTAPYPAYKNETYVPVVDVVWDYPDPTDPTTEVVRPADKAPTDKPYNKPDDVPDYPNWVDQDGNPYVPGQTPTKDTTYVPVFDITWDNPTEPDEVVKVPYHQPVNKPADDKLEGDLENQPWKNEDGVPYTAPYPAYKDETYKPVVDITWDYPDPTDPTTEVVRPADTVPVNDPYYKPTDVPDYPNWVDQDGNPYVPGQTPTKNTTYVPVFTINWGDPDVKTPYKVDEVPYKQPVNKPADTELPPEVQGKPDADWLDKADPTDNTPYTPHPATKDETFVPLFTINWKPDNDSANPDKIDKTEKVKQGVTPAAPATNPVKTGKSFSKWDPTPYPADKDQDYIAQYTGGGGGGGGGAPTYTVTWYVEDANGTHTHDGKKYTEYYKATGVAKNSDPATVFEKSGKPKPTKTNAAFKTWTPEYEKVTKNQSYYAVFHDFSDPGETGISKVLETGEHIIYYRGYPDGTIKPNGNITRAETAMILYRLLLNKDAKKTAAFGDVPSDAWYATAVNTLAGIGIVNGDPENNFHPDDPITRAEFTTMCVRFVKAQEASYSFSDVDEKHWAYKEIMTAAYYGWITGYNDGTFRPNAFIARCEAAAVVNRMLGRVADQNYVDKHEKELIYFPDLLKEWYYYEMVEGTNAHDYDKPNGKETWKSMYDK